MVDLPPTLQPTSIETIWPGAYFCFLSAGIYDLYDLIYGIFIQSCHMIYVLMTTYEILG